MIGICCQLLRSRIQNPWKPFIAQRSPLSLEHDKRQHGGECRCVACQCRISMTHPFTHWRGVRVAREPDDPALTHLLEMLPHFLTHGRRDTGCPASKRGLICLRDVVLPVPNVTKSKPLSGEDGDRWSKNWTGSILNFIEWYTDSNISDNLGYQYINHHWWIWLGFHHYAIVLS